jgi:hypothetical protein
MTIFGEAIPHTMIGDETLEKVLEWLSKSAIPASKARAERIYLEEYRKSLKALIMCKSTADSVAAKEVEAYANSEYRQHLEAIRIAVEADEKFRWMLTTAQVKVEVWRSEQANSRAAERVI